MKYRWFGMLGMMGVLANGCVGENAGDTDTSSGGGSSGGGSSSGENGSSSGGATSSGGGGTSSGDITSSSGGGASSSGGPVIATCDGADLVVGDDRTTCDLGCLQLDGGARCKVFEPLGPATKDDLLRPGLKAISLVKDQTVNVTTGEIGNGLRQANAVAETDEVKNQIAFRLEDGVAIFVAQSISIEGQISFVGTVDGITNTTNANVPVVFVAQQDATVQTVLRLPCGRLGGGAGGNSAVNGGLGAGPGGGKMSSVYTGEGGDYGSPGGQAGPAWADGVQVIINPTSLLYNDQFNLVGGSGGGAGNGGNKGSRGGSGGGAIGLVAGHELTVAAGSGINAGGCGGTHKDNPAGASGGGGGSGGYISVEAPAIRVLEGAGFAANGGGGAGRNGSAATAAGADASFSATPAAGGGSDSADSCFRKGGQGGAGSGGNANGGNASASANCNPNYSGGGGGGVGRIRISTRNAQLTTSGATVLSPSAAPQVNYASIDIEP